MMKIVVLIFIFPILRIKWIKFTLKYSKNNLLLFKIHINRVANHSMIEISMPKIAISYV